MAGPRPSPYSVQMLDASSSNPVRAQPQRATPGSGGFSQMNLQGTGASRPGTNNASGNSTSEKLTPSPYELQPAKRDPFTSLNMSDQNPPPYDEHEKHPVGRSDHEVVELHEGGGILADQPQAIQTMVKMVTMLNFMKVICLYLYYLWIDQGTDDF